MNDVVREVVNIAPVPATQVGSQQAEIESCVEKALKDAGREAMVHEEISVEVERSPSAGELMQVTFTLLSGTAREIFREIILPSLMKRYKATYEAETTARAAFAQDEATHLSAAPEESPAVPFPSLGELMVAHADLLKRELEMTSPAAPEFLTEVKKFIRNGRETGAHLESPSERRAAQSLLNYWITVLYRAEQRELPDAILVPYMRPAMVELQKAKCPYVGLQAYTEADRDVFFGRKELISGIVGRMRDQRLIVLVGPSGSGKTSVINAGVLPTLREGKMLEGSDKWHYFHPIAPGAEPLVSLAALFVEHNAEFAENVKGEAAKMLADTEYLTRLVKERYGDQPVVIILDQFEEVFTLCKDDPSREAFIANLLNLIKPTTVKHRLLLTMRSDRLDYIVRRTDLNEFFKNAELRIFPLLEPDLREVIEKPAHKIGLKFHPGVVEQLIREIYGDLVGLPLLQFTLTKLWQEKDGDTVTWASMNRLSTCRRALLRSADDFYKSLTRQEKHTARRIGLKMVRLSDTLEVAGDSARRRDFERPGEPPERISAVLAKLMEYQLVRFTPACSLSVCTDAPQASDAAITQAGTSPDDQFELAHDALVRYWPKMRSWLKKLREALVTRQRLEAFAANWVILGRGHVGLLDEFQLHEAETWLQSPEAADLGYDPDLLALIEKSRAVIKLDKFQRKAWRYGFIGVTLLGLVIAVWFALHTQNLFTQAVSRQLAAQAVLSADTQHDLSLLLSLESYRRDKGAPEAMSGLLAGLTYSPHLSAYLHTQAGAVKQLAFSPDNKTLISLGRKGTTIAWDVEQRRPQDNGQRDKANGQPSITESDNFILSPSGGKLAIANATSGAFVLWDVQKGEPLWTRQTAEAAFSKIGSQSSQFTFSRDEKRLAWINEITAASNGTDKYTLVLWNLEDNNLRSIDIEAMSTRMLNFSPDNKILAYATKDGEVGLLDADKCEHIGEPLVNAYDERVGFSSLVFSKDGKRLASMPDPRTIMVSSLEDQKNTNKSKVIASAERAEASALALSPDGSMLVAGYEYGTIVFWNVNQPDSTEFRETPDSGKGSAGFNYDGKTEFHEKHSSMVTSILFSDDGKKMVSLSKDNGRILLWEDFKGVRQLPIDLKLGRSSKAESIVFSPNGETLAVGTDDGTIVLWGIGKESLTGRTFVESKGKVNDLAFYANGTKLLTRTTSGEITLYDDLHHPEKMRLLADNATRNLYNSTFSMDGKILAASYSDSDLYTNSGEGGGIILWDISSGQERIIPTPESTPGNDLNEIFSLAVSPDNRKLAAGWTNGEITLWTLDQPTLLHTLKGEPDVPILSLAFNDDSTRLASGADSGIILLWETASGSQIKQLPHESNTTNPVTNLVFTSDGAKLISVNGQDTINFWDMTKAEQHASEKSSRVSSIAIGTDKRTLVSGSYDGSVSLWDIETHQQLGKLFDGNSPVVSLAYHGQSVAAGRQNGSVILIDASFETWRNLACRFTNRNLSLWEWRDSKYKLWRDQDVGWKGLFRKKESFYCSVCRDLPPGKDAPNEKKCDL